MPTLVPDRLSIKTIRQDYWRSLRRYRSGKRDRYAVVVIFFIPVGLGLVAGWPLALVITAPEALLAAVTLLAGVLLAAAGQIVTLRARIADSLRLSTDTRITGQLRETLSGILLASVAALGDAVLLGSLAVMNTQDARWWHILISAVVISVTAFIAMMFIVSARRMYSTYLDVFEDGAPLPKTPDPQ